MMRVLDLFAGLEGWAEPWRDRGHETFSVDWDERFKVDLHADINTLRPADLPWKPDVILASPPCECFTVLTIGRNWTHEHEPKTEGARQAKQLLAATVALIQELDPAYFIIENPRAKMRRMPEVAHLERRTVTYCQYGEPFMKPTDLWGGFPPSLILKDPCKNGATCHVAAPRGSKTGIQGEGVLRGGAKLDKHTMAALRAKVPYALSLAVCEAAESDLATSRAADRPQTLF